MNVFKGLLYLIDNDAPASPVRAETVRYGAATAASEFAQALGNRAASQRRFGTSTLRADAGRDTRLRAAGGCR